MVLALWLVAIHAGCLHEASEICGNRGVCPTGLQCADTGDDRICILVTCGNGRIDPGEACDDGNNRSGDGCPADCSAPCGDGVRDPDEACDDGNTNDGDGCSADCKSLEGIFLVSPTMVTLTVTEGDPLPAAVTVSIHLQFRGDSVLVGYAPGVPQPTWLSIMAGASTSSSAEFRLQVTDTAMVGAWTTSVRFLFSHQSSTGMETFDLPVAYTVQPSDLAVQATPAALAFAAIAGGGLPPAQTASVTFNGMDASVVTAPLWATVTASTTPTTSPASFAVSVNSTSFAPGTALSGDIVFGTRRGALLRTTPVHVDYNLVASAPEVQFVAPYLGIAARGGTLRVRGHGFLSLGGPVTIGIGELTVGPVTPDSDSQITVSYPPLPEGRYPVTFNPPVIASSSAELVVVTPPAFGYQAIDTASPRTRLLYDAERQAIYGVNRQDQQIDHFVYAGGAWSRLSPHVIPQLADAALAPDGRSLVVLDRDAINETSLADGLFTLVRRVDNPDPFCGGAFDQAVPANNGEFFIVFALLECSGGTPTYLYDLVSHSMGGGTDTSLFLYDGIAGASGDGARIYAGSANIFPSDTVETFESLNNSILHSTVDINLTAVSVSGDASRVILDNSDVYSRALVFTGHIPSFGVTLASRDSSRAFTYVEDATGGRLEVYDLNGPLQSGAAYPLLKTLVLPDAANGTGYPNRVVMTSSLDDSAVFISGDSKLLVVPVN